MKKLKNTSAYAYLLPSFLIFGIFLFYPFFKTLYLSLFKTNKMGQAKLLVGLGNYKELLQSSSFWNSLAVTLIFVVIVVAVSMILRGHLLHFSCFLLPGNGEMLQVPYLRFLCVHKNGP